MSSCLTSVSDGSLFYAAEFSEPVLCHGRDGISICADGICTILLIVRCYVAAIGVVSMDGSRA